MDRKRQQNYNEFLFILKTILLKEDETGDRDLRRLR